MSIHHPNSPWTEARVAKLREMWPDYSASKIAKTLGCFRQHSDGGKNAVIGKAHRLGLPSKAPTRSDAKPSKRARCEPSPPRNIGGAR